MTGQLFSNNPIRKRYMEAISYQSDNYGRVWHFTMNAPFYMLVHTVSCFKFEPQCQTKQNLVFRLN